jgi:hypothetical protein
MRPLRPCLDCGTPTRNPGSRCRPHELAHQRARNEKRKALYGGSYPRLRRQLLERATHCPRCGIRLVRSQTAVNGATYDHTTDLVLCRSCNSSQRKNPD